MQSVPTQAETNLRLLTKSWWQKASVPDSRRKCCIHLTEASFHTKQIAKVLFSRTILEVNKKIKLVSLILCHFFKSKRVNSIMK